MLLKQSSQLSVLTVRFTQYQVAFEYMSHIPLFDKTTDNG